MMQQPPPAANGAAAAGSGRDQQAYHHQQWMMMMQQQQQQGQPPAGWNPQSSPSLGQQQQYGGGSQNPGSGGEIRSLWIGDLQPWMDESYLRNIFSTLTGELVILVQQVDYFGAYQSTQGNPGESDPTNTTIFVGALDESVTEDGLKSVFGQFGELVHVKIPAGKRCGFVQYANRACAEQALNQLNGTQLGGQSIRLSWGRSPNNKQTHVTQPDQGYYGYPPQGYEGYGYAPPPQDPSAHYGGYPGAGYGNYHQQPVLTYFSLCLLFRNAVKHDLYVVMELKLQKAVW
ncbi:hypothetical protein HID58_041920 [Brassica napus]|uniref:RRM domain-containing protein n=1 Tax=Brassica napus TaxID=3708 RepID=A0ABQ8BC83_BRANA|nr:hypothetical protein HID58_041920 [Brassica napus]